MSRLPNPVRPRMAVRLVQLSLLLIPAAAPAQTGRTLTLEEAVSLARSANPSFLAQANDVRAARAATRGARASFLPSASVGTSFGYTAGGEPRFGSVQFESQPEYYSSSYRVGLSYDLSGAKLMQPAITRANERATVRRVEGSAAELDAQVAEQYLLILQAQDELAQAEREVARTAQHEELARARLAAGSATTLDVRRAEVQKGEAEVRQLRARNDLALARVALGQLLGTPLGEDVRLSSDFALFDPPWTPEELLQRALRANPGLLAARASFEAAGTGVRAARSAYLPSVSMDVGVSGAAYRAGDLNPLVSSRIAGARQRLEGCRQNNQLRLLLSQPPVDCAPFQVDEAAVRRAVESENSGFPFNYERQPLSATMTISLPVFTGGARGQRIEEARVAAEDAEYQVRATELRLRLEARTAILNLQTARRAAELQAQVRANAEEELRLSRERFRFGAANSVELIDAQTNLAKAEQAQIAAVYEFHRTLARLEALVGGSLRGGAGNLTSSDR